MHPHRSATAVGRSHCKNKHLSLGHCQVVPGASLHLAVTGAGLQLHGVMTDNRARETGTSGVKRLVWGIANETVALTPRLLGSGSQ